MTRRIVSFRRVGEHYRRDDEVHRVRLFEPSEMSAQLRAAGFRVRMARPTAATRCRRVTRRSSPGNRRKARVRGTKSSTRGIKGPCRNYLR